MTQESRLVIVIDSKNAERNTRAVADELANLTNKGVQADTQMTAMSSSIKSLVGYMGGLLTINKAIAMADGYTQMAARIRNATQSAEEYTLVQDRLLNTANTTFRALGEAQEVYLSMAGGMKSLGKSTKDTLDLTDSLSFSFTHNATRVDQAQSAMDALSKSMAKGKVDGDAWISIVTGADNVIADMAKTTGKTESEIRKLGAEGKVSLEDLIKTLILTRDENEKLANNMENSLADGFTKLSNEVTVYLGKANEATSATGILAGSLGILADNLDIVANTGAAIGLGYVTTALLTKGAVVKKSIVDSIARRAADQAEIQSQLQLAAVEVQRTRQIEALAIQEVHLARLELNSAITRTERAAATMRLTQAEVALGIASKQTTAATAANTVVQNANNASKRAGILTSTSLMGVLGGPVGLGVTVATVAAGYLLMRDSADKATVSIDFQGKSVGDLVIKYRELNTLQRDNETKALADQVEELSLKFRVASSDLTGFMQALPVADEKINTWSKLHSQFSLGKISSDEYYKSILALNILNDDQLDKVRGLIGGYDSSNKGMKEAEVAQKALAAAAKKTTQEAKDQAVSVADLSEKIKELLKSSNQNITDSKITSALASRGYNDTMIDLAKKYLAVDGAIVENAQGQKVLRDDLKKMLKAEYDAIMKAKGAVDSRNEAEKERTKELEKQQKVLQVNSKVQANAAKYNFAGLETKNGLPKGLLSAIQMQESRGDTYRNSKLLTSPAGAQGSFQFMPATAKRFNVNVEDMASSAAGAAKYLGKLLKMFGGDVDKAIMAYNAGEGNVQSGKAYGFKETKNYREKINSYMAGSAGFKEGDISSKEFDRIIEESTRVAIEQAKARTQLEVDVSNEVAKIRANLQAKLDEIDAANFSPEKAKTLKAEYQSRADNDIAIAQYALKTKLDDYAAFKKTEEQLLKDSFNQKKFYAARDLELTKDQRNKSVALLESQYQQELGYIKLAKEQRMFQMREQFMTETVAMEEQYRIEHLRLIEINDLEERNFKQQMLRLQKQEEVRNRLNNAVQNWGSTQAEMNGTGEQRQIEQTRFSRYDQSQELFDSQMSSVDQQAQDPNANLEAIAAQREAIWQAHHKRMNAIEADYQISSVQLQLSYGEQMASSMTTMMGTIFGEKSRAYAAAFAIEKGFAVAQAALAMGQNIAEASKVGFPYNIPMIAGAMAQGAQIASIISSVAAPSAGYKSGGYTGNVGVNQEAGVVHGQEYVLNAEATKRVGVNTLNAINNGGTIQAEKQAQANAKVGGGASPNVNLNPNFVIVDEREKLGDYLYGADGKKAFVKFFKQNRRELGLA
ncbi:hypothetical protein B9T23_01715 [Acinetobacter terrae]|uniref:tape measure protein n=1 Tax=Acinetobacter terrae TaxID=2731247 RepID=UPI000A3314E5|nr:tape measure protein [Acinetobacter terrae]OTG78812.1 hypothetical protein B9T23_01715 [Acinetobacter terrae]